MARLVDPRLHPDWSSSLSFFSHLDALYPRLLLEASPRGKWPMQGSVKRANLGRCFWVDGYGRSHRRGSGDSRGVRLLKGRGELLDGMNQRLPQLERMVSFPLCDTSIEFHFVLCVITLLTTPISPSRFTAQCALFGLALCRFVHPKKLLAQYLFLASWFVKNSW